MSRTAYRSHDSSHAFLAMEMSNARLDMLQSPQKSGTLLPIGSAAYATRVAKWLLKSQWLKPAIGIFNGREYTEYRLPKEDSSQYVKKCRKIWMSLFGVAAIRSQATVINTGFKKESVVFRCAYVDSIGVLVLINLALDIDPTETRTKNGWWIVGLSSALFSYLDNKKRHGFYSKLRENLTRSILPAVRRR